MAKVDVMVADKTSDEVLAHLLKPTWPRAPKWGKQTVPEKLEYCRAFLFIYSCLTDAENVKVKKRITKRKT